MNYLLRLHLASNVYVIYVDS